MTGWVLYCNGDYVTAGGYTNDVQLALRFARKEDAAQYVLYHGAVDMEYEVVPVVMAEVDDAMVERALEAFYGEGFHGNKADSAPYMRAALEAALTLTLTPDPSPLIALAERLEGYASASTDDAGDRRFMRRIAAELRALDGAESRDAGRYRWLRDGMTRGRHITGSIGFHFTGSIEAGDMIVLDSETREWDAAIDAAMSPPAGKENGQ